MGDCRREEQRPSAFGVIRASAYWQALDAVVVGGIGGSWICRALSFQREQCAQGALGAECGTAGNRPPGRSGKGRWGFPISPRGRELYTQRSFAYTLVARLYCSGFNPDYPAWSERLC